MDCHGSGLDEWMQVLVDVKVLLDPAALRGEVSPAGSSRRYISEARPGRRAGDADFRPLGPISEAP